MSLDNLYSLRKDFTIIGLTGRLGSGCTAVAKLLSKPDLFKTENLITIGINKAEVIKYNICHNFINHDRNWQPYTTIDYKTVLLLFLTFESLQNSSMNSDDDTCESFIDTFVTKVFQFGDDEQAIAARFKSITDIKLAEDIKALLTKHFSVLKKELTCLLHCQGNELYEGLKKLDQQQKQNFYTFFNSTFKSFSTEFYQLLNDTDKFKRSIFIHDLANCLRKSHTTEHCRSCATDGEAIYTVAKVINQLIKIHRVSNHGKGKIVIDSLKNSLELMYFKEKFSAFYMVAVKRDDSEREEQVHEKLDTDVKLAKSILDLDETEYSASDYSEGSFTAPDVINCIQRSDYHLQLSNKKNLTDNFNWDSTESQLLKLIALIEQPGIITPTAVERTMQFAYNAKFNSGCISRQVGAVITDENFSVKSIGWNDVAKGQLPCKLRDARELLSENQNTIFSEYELNDGTENKQTKEKIQFKDFINNSLDSAQLENLNGKPCPFCFKSFQNKLEGHDNQVHTRSLHAEENAMLQISRNGGIGLHKGKLFTTASPCELCSKKAFQIGVSEIYYIDPYPGIAMKHTLKNGIIDKDNPPTIMFKGAVGQAFHKLYEPFMSYKDEVAILSGFKPQKVALNNNQLLDQMDLSPAKKAEIEKILHNDQL